MISMLVQRHQFQLSSMANHSSGLLPHQAYPLVPKVQPESENFEPPSEVSSLRGYGQHPNDHALHGDVLPGYNSHLISSDSYNFLTGAELLAAPSESSSHSPGADVGTAQRSSLLGTLDDYSNPILTNSGKFSSHSTALSKSNSWGSLSAAAGQQAGHLSISLQNILTSGSGILATTSNTAETAQIVGGLHGSSFERGDHKDATAIYFSSSNSQPEAMQLYYVNPGFAHGYSSDASATVLYPPEPGETAPSSQQDSTDQQDQHQFRVPFIPPSLAQSALSQRALEAIAPNNVPLTYQAHIRNIQGSRTENQNYNSWRNGGNELLFLPSNEASLNAQSQFGSLSQFGVSRGANDLSHMHHQPTTSVHGGDGSGSHIEHSYGSVNIGQGLSLSLSSHQPQSSALQFRSLHSHLPESGIGTVAAALSHAAAEAKAEGASSRYVTGANASLSRFRRSVREAVDIIGGRQHHVDFRTSGPAGSGGSNNYFTASRFLRSAQEILVEVCRVTPCKRSKPARSEHWMAAGSSASIEGNLTHHGKDECTVTAISEVESTRNHGSFPDTSASVTAVSHLSEVSQSAADTTLRTDNREDLHIKKGKLALMLDEVERSYRQYCDQLQIVISGFNSQAGLHAATPYTVLALQAMSRHFRCLRDAIGGQYRVMRRALGEDDFYRTTGRGETSRLRYVDQRLRQQRALQQLGMLQQHAWRPQRGLPERAVSVLRAWLFEHFLHPYPKDADKLLLAKQTALTRSQVSNWFINARVRLWKPMVEEMYMEEEREAEEGRSAHDRILPRDEDDNVMPSYGRCNDGARSDSAMHGDDHGNGLVISMSQHGKEVIEVTEEAGGCDDDGQVTDTHIAEQQQDCIVRNDELIHDTKRARSVSSTEIPDSLASPGLNADGDNCGKSQDFTDDICKRESDHTNGHEEKKRIRDQEIYRAHKGASIQAALETTIVGGGGFVSAFEGRNLNTYGGYSAYINSRSSTIGNGDVSLTLGLRHCDAGLSPMDSSMQQKYNNMGLYGKTSMEMNRHEYDSSNSIDRSSNVNNGHYLQISQDMYNNSNLQISPSRKRLASQLLQHDFVA